MDDKVEQSTREDDSSAVSDRRPRDASLASGYVLNGIYKVERFIARGGMGEVFAGVNVETDERVAIKAIRSHLASDPRIVALFRKEARVLTHISHPAIVQYRVFARDPQLDLHYIVTDFINGEPITRHLDRERPSIADVVALARRLASGLEAAHDHGAIHRDMSPDNILLPDGRIDRAKIIDFGIAKSPDLAAETVVGEGFAGKIGYVAPEQFGDFGRQIGPWTDVYSTALVLLAFARGKAPAMGTTLSEAVERRRIPVDLSDLPVPIAPLIERMLVPEPARRIRSMREVLVALDGIRITPDLPHAVGKRGAQPRSQELAVKTAGDVSAVPLRSEAPKRPAAAGNAEELAETTYLPSLDEDVHGEDRVTASPPDRTAPFDEQVEGQLLASQNAPGNRRKGGHRKGFVVAAVLGLLLLMIWTIIHRHAADHGAAQNTVSQPAQSSNQTHAAPLLAASDRAAQWNLAVRDLPCAWITARPTTEDGPTELSGGSGELPGLPARLGGKPVAWGSVETKAVEPLNVTQCGVIDVLRPYRAKPADQGAGVLALSTTRILLDHPGPACAGGGVADVTATSRDPEWDWALIGLEPDGRLLQIAGSKAEFTQLARQQSTRFSIGADHLYHASLCHGLTGSAAIFLIEAKHPINLGLHTGRASLPGSDFAQLLADQGRDQGMRIFAQWARIEPAPAGSPPATSVAPRENAPASSVVPIQPGRHPSVQPVVQHEVSREQSVIDTAEQNRRELARIQQMESPDGNADLCRAYDGQWYNVGRLSRDACIAQAFKGRCKVTFVQFKSRLFRRQGEEIQEQRGNRWKQIDSDKVCEAKR